jgi:hypothetical protein
VRGEGRVGEGKEGRREQTYFPTSLSAVVQGELIHNVPYHHARLASREYFVALKNWLLFRIDVCEKLFQLIHQFGILESAGKNTDSNVSSSPKAFAVRLCLVEYCNRSKFSEIWRSTLIQWPRKPTRTW